MERLPPASHSPISSAPPVQDHIEILPAAPDLNLPDPDVLVNQLGMLVTAADGESMRSEAHASNQGKQAAISLSLSRPRVDNVCYWIKRSKMCEGRSEI